ncbi:MAG TPA: aminopeptidase [Gaiellaceae bacterium]|nr:aminopeptidase [Gaiellaceae bacterium]
MAENDQRWTRLAELAVHGANVQPGQIVAVASEHGQARLAREVAAAAYRSGAKFVDVAWFDTYVKEARVRYADPDTLEFVPPWYGERVLALSEIHAARITFSGVSTPRLFQGLDPALVGKDRLPVLKEAVKLISDGSTNWCLIPCPHVEWSRLVYPDLDDESGLERLWQALEHVLRLDEPDPNAAWDERMNSLTGSAQRLNGRRFDALEYRGPGTDLRVGLFKSGSWHATVLERVDGLRHFANLPTEEVFTSPDPARTDGHVAATKPLVLVDGTIVRGLRVRFEGGRAVDISADENADALRGALAVDDAALRLGEVALVDNKGRIGSLCTVFYNTLLDENAASHIALGNGFSFTVGDDDRDRVNQSGTHIDFMIGSPELEVDGITADGDKVPVLRGGDWQI